MNTQVKCPCCRVTYHSKYANPAIKEALYQTYILYALCPDCKHQYDSANGAEKKDIANECFINFKTKGKDISGVMHPWSVTNEITLHTNGYEIDQALINGQRIPREICELVEKGEIAISCLPLDLYGMPPHTLVLD